MKNPLTVCIELDLPPALAKKARDKARIENPANGHALEGVANSPLLWKVGRTLRIKFLSGQKELQQEVISYAKQWSKYANIIFDFSNDPNAEIRILFREETGSSSYVGMEALEIPRDEPTMQLDLTPASAEKVISRTVLHEFGHVLGLTHEHQNPVGGILWDKNAVFKDLPAWDKKTIELNIFDHLSISQTQFTTFDPESIMLYQIPAHWTRNNYSTRWNYLLSQMDKHFVSMLYPR